MVKGIVTTKNEKHSKRKESERILFLCNYLDKQKSSGGSNAPDTPERRMIIMGKTALPAQDLYVGAVKIFNADGSIAEAVTLANNDVVAAKIAANAVETAKIKDANVTAAKLATNAVETLKIKDVNVTLAKLAVTAKTQILTYQVEDLAANADIADRVIFEAPTGIDVTLATAKIIPQGNAAGIDDSNKCVIKLSDGTNTIVEATFDADPAFPAAAAATSLGTLSSTYKVLAAGEKLYLSVTNGTAADPPAFMLIVTYTVADAV